MMLLAKKSKHLCYSDLTLKVKSHFIPRQSRDKMDSKIIGENFFNV